MVIDIEIYKDEVDGTITLCWDNYLYEAPDVAEGIWSYAELAEKMLFLPEEVLTFGEPEGKLVFVQKFYVED